MPGPNHQRVLLRGSPAIDGGGQQQSAKLENTPVARARNQFGFSASLLQRGKFRPAALLKGLALFQRFAVCRERLVCTPIKLLILNLDGLEFTGREVRIKIGEL